VILEGPCYNPELQGDVIATVYYGETSKGVKPPHCKFGIIDKKGQTVSVNRFQAINDFSEGLAVVVVAERQWGFIDQSGSLAAPATFELARSSSDGLAAVENSAHQRGYVDQTVGRAGVHLHAVKVAHRNTGSPA